MLAGAISEFVMVGLLYVTHPMKPPQLMVLLVVAKEPSNTQPSMVTVLFSPASVPTNPPWVPSWLSSPVTVLLTMLMELRQPVMLRF